jgi:hypothetical protein
MTRGPCDEGTISYACSSPIEAIFGLRVEIGARLETSRATKRIARRIAIGRAIRRNRAPLAS